MKRGTQAGFSLIELMVGLVVSSLVLGGAYSLWKTHQVEGYRLGKKIELRNVMTLSSKRIQRSVTLAGFGLGGAAPLAKDHSAGSDTLSIFSNTGGARCALLSSLTAGTTTTVQVADPSLFQNIFYVAVSNDTNAEIRRITTRSGSVLEVESAFTHSFSSASAMAIPAIRERYYTDQGNNALMREEGGTAAIVAKDVKDFQVTFRDQSGASTAVPADVRSVLFSFTGIFPAAQGAINSITFSSTAIPRNTL